MTSVIKTGGYEVPWNKSPVVNTRVDSAMKKMWLEATQKRRCIIPTFGFYEPHQKETTVSKETGKRIKQKYFFQLLNSPVTFIAGIYEDDHFSMMTTDPSSSMRSIHNRMPVVLRQAELTAWLFGNYQSLFDRSSIELRATKELR